jgi:hypothetical protein
MIRFGLVILLLWLGLTLLTVESAPAPRAWRDWPPDRCRLDNCYCEPLRPERLVAQPAASYSNLGLLAAGVFVMWAALRLPPAGSSPMGRTRVYPLAYGLALAAVGLFSFFYHASLTRAGDYFDLMGMFLFTSFLLLYNLSRIRPLGSLQFALAYLALNVTLAAALVVAYDLQQVFFAVLAAAALAIEGWILYRRRPQITWPLLAAALACFGIGAAIWILDSRGTLTCVPDAPVTWHAVWHLSIAVTAALLFFYYRSEEVATQA